MDAFVMFSDLPIVQPSFPWYPMIFCQEVFYELGLLSLVGPMLLHYNHTYQIGRHVEIG